MLKYFIYTVFFFAPSLPITSLNPPVSFSSFNEVFEEKPDLYSEMNLAGFGLDLEVFNVAFKGFNKLKGQGRLPNSDILTIVDFSQTSKNKRMYVIDFANQEVVHHTYVAHGRNTGDEFAKKFSNVDGSWQSSLGFYLTKGTNMGASVGFSLIMEGLEKGFNDNAQRRQIIVHGAEYATENFIKRTGRLGRSFGCPAVPPEEIEPIVETIKNGSCLFIYYPDSEYLNNSSILN